MGEPFALHPHGYASGRNHIDQPDLAPAVGYVTGLVSGVQGRVGVGHGDHGGITTGGGGPGTGGNILLPFLTGFSQMDVQVHQAGSQHQAGQVEHPGPGPHLRMLPGGGKNLLHPVGHHQHIGHQLAASGHHGGTFQQQPIHYLPPSSRNRMAILTATPLAT